MTSPNLNPRNILVTGGTSGLGLELVGLLLKEGYNVTATGRREADFKDQAGRFSFCRVDFSSLEQVADVISDLALSNRFNIIINNAGILSPPHLTLTRDGLEHTFQVNFLAHLLINEIIISRASDVRSMRIISVTSPVYKIGRVKDYLNTDEKKYRPVRAYSSSKLYLAMMNQILAARHGRNSPLCCSFDPGTFSSGIYRMQKRWFREMYHVAAPFMRSPQRVASSLVKLIESDEIIPGMIYDISLHPKQLLYIEDHTSELFIQSCYDLISNFVNNK